MVVVAKKHFQQAPPESFEEQVLRRFDVVGLKPETIAKDLHVALSVVRRILLAFERIDPVSPRADSYQWDDTFLDQAKAWWAAGEKSGQEIADLDPTGGLTRNMVMKKMNQLGIVCGTPRGGLRPHAGRPRTIAPPAIDKRRGGCIGNGTKAKPFVSPIDALEPLGPEGDFPPANTCRWSYGDPGRDRDWRMCGRPQASGRPYCDAHVARAVDSAGTRRLQALQG
jgi:hypothetical protein